MTLDESALSRDPELDELQAIWAKASRNDRREFLKDILTAASESDREEFRAWLTDQEEKS